MKVDPIQTKPKNLSPSSAKQKNFIIPIIIIILVIAVTWLLTLKYNFSRLDTKSQKNTDSTTEEVNAALKNLTEEFDKLKETKVFKTDGAPNSGQPKAGSENLPSQTSTTTQAEPSPPNQY